jgi:hypothetical protein
MTPRRTDDTGISVLTIDRLVITGPAVTLERAERLRALVEMAVRRRLSPSGDPNDTDAARGHGRRTVPDDEPDRTVTLGPTDQDTAAAEAIAGREARS